MDWGDTTRGEGETSWRKDSILPYKLGEAHYRPMGPQNSLRIPSGVPVNTMINKVAKATHARRRKNSDPRERDRRITGEEGSEYSALSTWKLHQPDIPGTKRRRIMETSNQPEKLNQFIVPHHFKMEGIRALKGLIRENDWAVKLDLKDAYLFIQVYPPHQKFLGFQWQERIVEFKSLPFGLQSAPYAFTKLLKPVIAALRRLVIRCILYLDDMLILDQDKEELQTHLATAMELLILLGFIINTNKSVFKPTQHVEFLGFQINSQQMSLALLEWKVEEIKESMRRLRSKREVATRRLARLLGGSTPSSTPSPTLLPTTAITEDQGCVPVGLRIKDSATLTSQGGAKLVAGPLGLAQWQQFTDHPVGSDNRDGCLNTGWGASCQGDPGQN